MNERKKMVKVKLGIRLKIMMMTTMIVVGVMLVCAVIMRNSMQNLTQSILLDVLQPMVNQSAKAVEANVHLMADRMISLAKDERLTGSLEKAEDMLKDSRNTYEFYGIGVYDLDGAALAADGQVYKNLKETEWFSLLQETDNLTISDPVVTEKYVGIPIAMPIKAGGATSAYLVGVYKYDMLSEVLNTIHIGKSGMALIINERGKIVGHPDTEIVEQELNIYELDTAKSAHNIFDRMVSREIGAAEGIVNGQDSYIAFSPVRGTKWSFAIEVPKTDYMESTNIALNHTLQGTFIALVIALLCIWVVTSIISNHLKKSIVRMNGLAEGDLQSQVEVEHTRDETEMLSAAVKSTVESMNLYIMEIRRVLDNISNGNLNISADGEYRGDFIVIKEALARIISSLNVFIKQVNHTSCHLADTAENMGSQSEELRNSVISQTDAVENLNVEVETIRQNLNDVTNSTHETTVCAFEIAQQISNGNQKMKELQAAMEAIDHSAENIAKINKLIEKIAQQTNILALNASVEAARAGESGKGFAVVAEEVRALAAQSSEFAKNTVEVINTTSGLIKQGVLLTEEASYSLEEISHGSEAVTRIAGRLSDAVHIQENSLQEITEKIHVISAITQQNLQCAQNTADASVGLEMEAKKLKHLLEKFKFTN